MPSVKLVKTWLSDKNVRTAHANITLRCAHTNADECGKHEFVYFASTKTFKCAKRANDPSQVISDACLRITLREQPVQCQWNAEKDYIRLARQGQCRAEQRSRKCSNVT